MRYSDLVLRFDQPKYWSFEPENFSTPMTYAQYVAKKDLFERKKEELREGVVKSIEEPLSRATTEEEVGMFLDPIFEQYAKSYFMSESVNQDLLLRKANKNTLNKKLQDWCKQLNFNVPTVRKYPGVKIYFNEFKNIPAVVVCAGPSLGNSIERLKKLQDKVCIIACDTAYRSLVKRGIYPHFVNAHDANPQGARFFQGMDSSKTVALFVNYISPLTIGSYQGPKAFYYVQDESIPTYETMCLACDGPDRPDGSFKESSIVGGSSVAHTAYYGALAFGFNPVTFIGLDLSYPDMTKSHFESDNMKDLSQQKLIDVVDIQGRKTKTNLSFYSYKTVFDRVSPQLRYAYNAKIFTSTEGSDGKVTGIVYNGLEPLPFDDFIKRYCQRKQDKLSKIQSIYKSYMKEE